MEKITQYKEAIRRKYEIAKNEVNSDYLLHPSPARLRDLCCLLFEKGLNNEDLIVFSRFFGYDDVADKLRFIREFDRDKFKPIQSLFLRGTDLAQLESINLAAVLVDFEMRPFIKFRGEKLHEEKPDPKSDLKPTDPIISYHVVKEKAEGAEKAEVQTSGIKPPGSSKRLQLAAIAIVIISSGFMLKTIYFPAKNCMIWTGSQYEAISCDEQREELSLHINRVEPRNDELLCHMKKITPGAGTVYFKNDKPCIWYSSQGGVYEYFTWHGLHPVTGKTLRPITRTIIFNHIMKKKP